MTAVIANICVDPRLLHDVLRSQIQTRLQTMGLSAERVFLTNDIGGNIGSSLQNTLEMLACLPDPVVLLAVLHHDDCAAERAGRRRTLDSSIHDLTNLAAGMGLQCPVLSGNILTENSAILWTAQPQVE